MNKSKPKKVKKDISFLKGYKVLSNYTFLGTKHFVVSRNGNIYNFCFDEVSKKPTWITRIEY